jgi:hypothetical protein
MYSDFSISTIFMQQYLTKFFQILKYYLDMCKVILY